MPRPDRFRRLERDNFDAIVVGAGISGLTAAALLARRGLAVLVVDRHYVAGGNATVFRRKGYEFDIGIHYLGQCGPDGAIPRILKAAGAGGVRFRPLDPDGFDTLVYPDLELRVPRGVERYRERLLEAFPREQRAIDANARLIEQVLGLSQLPARPANAWRVLPQSLLALRNATSTLGQFLERYTRDPRLCAVLAGEGGDYALPPSRVSALMHAGLMAHYLSDGTYYPEGGGQVMSDQLAASIEQSGGKILLSTSVERILVESGKVRGVRLSNKHLGKVEVRAPIVLASNDVKQALLELIAPDALGARTRRRAAGWKMAPALGALYLGVRREALGSRGVNTNYWIYPSYDLEQEYAEVEAGRFSRRPFLFVSSASLKDPENPRLAPAGVVNLQLMSLAPSAPSAWRTSPEELASGAYRESPGYLAAKAEYSERLLAAAESVFPGLGRHVVFQELATPLTHARYTSSTGGTSYGIAATPDQFLWRRPGPKTEISGLYLCGASARSGHGIMGAMMGGLAAAAEISGAELVRETLDGPEHDARSDRRGLGLRGDAQRA